MNRVTKKRKKKSGKKFVTFMLFIIICFGIYFGYNIHKRGGGLQGFIATILCQDAEKLENLDTITVLLLRSKRRFRF